MNLDENNTMLVTHALKCALVDEVLRVFGAARLRVTGLSMLPSVWPGDTLIVLRRNIEEIAVGDIVLYCRNARLIAHRVVSAAGSLRNSISVQGDSLPMPDDLVLRSELLGTVPQIIRNGECIHPSSRPKYHERLIGNLIWQSEWLARAAVFMHSTRIFAWRRESQ
jgi:hypothetical protein